MSRCMKRTALLSEMLLLFVPMSCCCPGLFKKTNAEAPALVIEAPPPAPEYVAPPPAPPSPPPPPVLPPAVAKSIEDLSDKYPDLFKFDKDKSLLYFSADATFDSGSAVVKPDAQAALWKLARILNEDEAGDRRLTIIGHTDTDRVVKPNTIQMLKRISKSVDNMGLSEARAEAVAAVLQTGLIDASRMTTMGKGAAEPVADNRTPAGKARNRRVEIYVTPANSGA